MISTNLVIVIFAEKHRKRKGEDKKRKGEEGKRKDKEKEQERKRVGKTRKGKQSKANLPSILNPIQSNFLVQKTLLRDLFGGVTNHYPTAKIMQTWGSKTVTCPEQNKFVCCK